MPEPICKTILAAQSVKQNAEDLTNSMRRLRVALIHCERCPNQDCPAIVELTSEITSALQEITLEWNL